MFDCHLFARCQNQLYMVGRLNRTATAYHTSGSTAAAALPDDSYLRRLLYKTPRYYRKRTRFKVYR